MSRPATPRRSEHRLYAALYDRVMAGAEAAGLAARRRRLVAEARGRVLEVGGGTGANLAYYRDVGSLTILEPDAAMRRRLLKRAADLGMEVEVLAHGVDDAPLDEGSFDTVVSTLVLCTVPDIHAAARALRRALRPDGRLLFLEHTAGVGLRRRVQSLATPVWSRVVPGCHLDRDVTAALRGAGFVVTDCERFRLPGGGYLAGPAAQGVAVPARSRAVVAT